MKNTDYAFAVTTVRAKEAELVTPQFADALINAQSFYDAKRMMIDKGFKGFEATDDPSDALKDVMADTWDFIAEAAPDPSLLDFMIVKNDFHNLKAVLKAAVLNDTEPEGFYIYPCVCDPSDFAGIIKAKSFDLFPVFLRDTAREGYELLTSTLDGQLLDIYIDRRSLEETLKRSEKCGAGAKEIADAFAAVADIKTALRSASAKKGEQFLEAALCECDRVDISALKKAAVKGVEDVLRYLDSISLNELSACYRESYTAFERACDNMITDLLCRAKLISFGPEPVIAYFYAKETECKNLRIIMSCKHIGIDPKLIKERTRKLYV